MLILQTNIYLFMFYDQTSYQTNKMSIKIQSQKHIKTD